LWLEFTVLQELTAAYAVRLDRKRLGPRWALPLPLVVYRHLMYLVVVQSAVTALTGIRLRWHTVTRTGATRLRERDALWDATPPAR
jgi:hypothetical protein